MLTAQMVRELEITVRITVTGNCFEKPFLDPLIGNAAAGDIDRIAPWWTPWTGLPCSATMSFAVVVRRT